MDSKTSYEAAEIVEYSLWYTLKFLIKLLGIIFKSILMSVPEFLRWIKELIIPPKLKNISGQLALVTGGSTGIGKFIAFRLAKEGCNIAIANRNHSEGEKTATEIRERFGVNAKAFKVDVSKHEEVAKLKEDVERSLGNVDILVNNAGLLALSISLLEGTPQEIQQIIDTNITSYFWTTRQFLPGMIERKRGHVVSVSSLSAKVTFYNNVSYITTKFGNDGFMNALYDDLCLNGHDEFIKLTTAFPSFVGTQKKLVAMIGSVSEMPVADPADIGDQIVKGILLNRREFIVPPSSAILLFFKFLPDKAMKLAKLSFVNFSKMKVYEEIRKN